VIVVVDHRTEVTEAYRTTIGREGYSTISFNPEEFAAWFHSSAELDLSAVEAILLGDCDKRESLAKYIKSRGGIPAIALSDAAALETTIKLFQAGIDDVVRKPVHAREIIARIGAIRRRKHFENAAIWSMDGLVIFGDGRDPEVNGSVFQLPRRERRILEYLAASQGRRVMRSQVFSAIYGVLDDAVEECVVESHISKLRKKLRGLLGYDPIDTQRYLGYQLVGRMQKAA